MAAESIKCSATGKMCNLKECATWNCWIKRQTEDVLPEAADAINGLALKKVNKLRLGTGPALKLAESLSRYIAVKLASK